ncbi:MAG TPA: recombination protein RecR [Myxococcales bacterium]|nr:recombination protein RecR [Deltaproteobacteria bacterium]MBU47659.1 recombination protein RecR [Deltaproteobacteria bacterium]HAA58266.1 recombination protein RecR [Myxococcales bacterium]|tara:strand:- start:20371 stop:20985 length:615 start_codon:yes stop_codon:yes gene_type:complete
MREAKEAASRDPIRNLIDLMARLPGVGEKSATRMAFALLGNGKEYAYTLADGIRQLVDRIQLCSRCCNLTEEDPCSICCDPDRDPAIVCVIENVPDLLAIERTHEYRGIYHVLHGALAPLEGITPDKLRIQDLLERLEKEDIQEVILATNPTVEGDSTALYLRNVLRDFPVRVTRIASGVPMGGDLEYIDRATLSRALQGRREL